MCRVPFGSPTIAALAKSLDKRRELEAFTVVEIRDTEHKERLLAEAETTISELRIAADLIVAAALGGAGKRAALDTALYDLGVHVKEGDRVAGGALVVELDD